MHGSLSRFAGLVFALLFVIGCGTDSNSAAGTGGAGGTPETPPLGCDPLTPSYCGFPYPNDYWTVADATTVTGLRLALPEVTMPSNRNGVQSTPGAFNEMDGFSPGIAAMTHFPGATVEGLATPNSIEDSLSPDSPTVILNAATGERLAHWVDLDEYVVEAKLRVDAMADRPQFTINRELGELRQERALMLRPAIRAEDATRYIVAIRNVRDGEGALVAPSAGFLALRDDEPSGDDIIESRRALFEEIFETLEEAGIARNDLQIAWDFTTASRENNTRAMVHIRDDALSKYPDGVPYTIELKNEGLREGIECRLEITFDMPLYMTQGETGGLLNLGDDGLPEQNGSYPYAAAMIVPVAAQSAPAGLVAVGHGQLGAKEQVLGYQEIMAEANLAAFGMDHKGFASDDIPTVIEAILGGDLSVFRKIPERMHQGFLNFLMAMRTLSREAEGGPSTALNQALLNDCNGATIDGSKRYYFGGSQGGILGASIMALSTDTERALLAVPGQSYNLLLNRSVNFDEYAGQLYGNYDWNALDMQMNLALIQGLWDRAEPTGYSKYIRTNRLPGTPAHEVVIQVSKADHQVTNLGAHIMARTIGGVVNLAPLIRPVWGLDVVSGEHSGSAMIEIDFGNPDAPITNIPPWADSMEDPHGRATELQALGPILIDFFASGVVSNPCDGPCDENDLVVP
ncbi:MAG: hypothetical protein EX268_13855 [Deltaproteobacteria bacterium]|nr:hypothetical protein [Deltaproteobacteria bacterium]NNK06439.1 hypothetical protein [Myxococcales bacterium]RZV51705.1 MAG: hypothetical protein EX268_13855 [Deltaproteobacteria bacterium]